MDIQKLLRTFHFLLFQTVQIFLIKLDYYHRCCHQNHQLTHSRSRVTVANKQSDGIGQLASTQSKISGQKSLQKTLSNSMRAPILRQINTLEEVQSNMRTFSSIYHKQKSK